MIMRTISNPELFKVLDAHAHKTYYGCNQEWYNTEWQRRSGCAPAVASNIILYLSQTQDIPGFEKNCSIKEKCVSVLEEMWTFVTPTLAGIPSTRMFSDTVRAYAKANGLNVECFVYDVPDNKTSKPPLAEMVNFIETALIKDVPVAFLNLCHGDEKRLYSWHWVTITSLEYADNGNDAFVTILDEGLFKRIDLALWHSTTTLGGGFVYFILYALRRLQGVQHGNDI